MKINKIHEWELDYKEAVKLQRTLANKIQLRPVSKKPQTVAAIDCSFTRDKKHIISAVIVTALPGFEIIEQAHDISPLDFPYIPGLLSFREAPSCLKAVEKLQTVPEVFLIDGQGIAHPRKMGIAVHLGLFLDKPTVGCAKSRLIGEYEPPGPEKGSRAELRHKGQIIGSVVRTRDNVKPLYVSPGHLCTVENAVELTLATATKYRLPEPARIAHKTVTELKNGFKG